jgi:hypothetical protein
LHQIILKFNFMSTKFSKFSSQEKLSRKQLITVFGGSGTGTDGDDDHDGPKILKPVRPTDPIRPTGPTGGGN